MNYPEKLTPDFSLESLSIDEMHEIIKESNNVFLAPASDPTQTTDSLFNSLSKDPGFTALGYKVNGIPISYIIALTNKDPSTVSIGPMYVSTQRQGHGLGQKQVQDFADLARQQGFHAVYTKTWFNNVISRKVFTSLGFTEVGIKSGDRSDGDSTISYLLKL